MSAATPSALVTLVAFGAHEAVALEACVRDIAANSVLPGTHLCLVPIGPASDAARGDLERLARRHEPRLRWSLESPAGREDFADCLRRIAARFPGEDIALVAPGAQLPFAWDARLAKAAHAAPGNAIAVPMCDLGPLHALIEAPAQPGQQPDGALVDRIAYCMGERSYYEVPRAHPVCAYLRRDALDEALPTLGEGLAEPQSVLDALTRALRFRGRSCVLLDYLYVRHAGMAPAAVRGANALEEGAYLQNHPLGALRRAVGDAIGRGIPSVSVPGLDHRPVQLHIMHFWGGGLDKWVRDFGLADTARTNMILSSFRIGDAGGQRIVLYSDPAASVPIRVWDIAQPIPSTAPASLEYRRILDEIIDEFGVEAILVSSLIGHSLEALTRPVKTLLVCHDFYPICQAINPQFGGTCERCTLEDLRRCAGSNPLNRFFRDMPSEDWHAMRGLFVERLVAGGIEIVVPSPSVAATLRNLDPRLQGHRFHVIAHGIDLDAPAIPAKAPLPGEPLRLVVLGRLSLQKGTELLREAAAALRPYATITLLGCGEEGAKLARDCGWEFVERYGPRELPGALASLAPHASVHASVVPETFSYTLSELTALGVPSLATALGSFRDRIVDGETGFLFEPTAPALVELVRGLHAEPGRLARVAGNLAALPKGRSTAAMVEDYHRLVPLPERDVARFGVGLGRQSGLTEPYRHLTGAYAELTGAYARLDRAYEETRLAYEQTRRAYEDTRGEFDRFRKVWDAWSREFDALAVKRHWWRAPRALRITAEMRARMKPEGEAPAAPAPDRDET